MLLADLRHRPDPQVLSRLGAVDAPEARAVVDELAKQGSRRSRRKACRERRSVVAWADLRYLGQHHEVTITFRPDDLARLERIEAAFHAGTRVCTATPRPGSRWRS